MEDIIDLVATEASPADISAKIKEVLFAKAGEKVDSLRPVVAATMFDSEEQPGDNE